MSQRWVSLAERPDLFDAAVAIDAEASALGFTQHDEIGMLAHAYRLRTRCPDYFLVLTDEDRRALARGHGAAVAGCARSEELPSNGWDGAVLWAVHDALDNVPPTAACALEINVDPTLRGHGIIGDAVRAMRDRAKRNGLRTLLAPVRPPEKGNEPFVPMAAYAQRMREDGLRADRWLRVHVRAGGIIVGVAPASMVVVGTLQNWQEWTGEPFDGDGPIAVPRSSPP